MSPEKVYRTETIVLDSGDEWRQRLTGLKSGDEVRVDAIGSGPFYLVVASKAELEANRQSGNQRLTDFWRWKPRLRPRARVTPDGPFGTSRFLVGSGEEHFLVLGGPLAVDTVEADVTLSVVRPDHPADETNADDSVSRQSLPGAFPPGELVYQFGEWSRIITVVGWVFALAVAIGIVFLINLYAVDYGGGASALAPLLAGDGTLALAGATWWSLRQQAARRPLDAARMRERRN